MVIPGYIWGKVIFDQPGYYRLPLIERAMWTAVLSLVLVPMAFITINDFVAVPINPLSVSVFIGIISVPGLIIIYNRKRSVR